MILDCRFVNNYMDTPKFKQEGIEGVADLIQEGDEIVTVDLKDGFQHVPVHISSQTYFGMYCIIVLYVLYYSC